MIYICFARKRGFSHDDDDDDDGLLAGYGSIAVPALVHFTPLGSDLFSRLP